MTPKLNIIGIIPARMGSSRFPGKPLADLLGMPMVGHVYFRSKMSKVLNEVYIATYDQEIKTYADSIGAKCIVLKEVRPRASDCIADAMLVIEEQMGRQVDIPVLIQGDEPLITGDMIDMAVAAIQEDPSLGCVNLMAPIKSVEEHMDQNCPKVVVDKNNFALYFSREPIPSRKLWKKEEIPELPMYKQVCIIPFRRGALLAFNQLSRTPLEIVESIDMNRFLEHGHKVKMVPEDHETYPVDTPNDLRRVEQKMKEDPLLKTYAPRN